MAWLPIFECMIWAMNELPMYVAKASPSRMTAAAGTYARGGSFLDK
jgi:hypothetical protein